jgi:hypothetical protein
MSPWLVLRRYQAWHQRFLLALLIPTVTLACQGGVLNAGFVPLPSDNSSSVIITNDGGHDNWQGEFALTFAAAGDIVIAGIIITASPYWPDLNANLSDWTGLVNAARASGLTAPSPIASIAPALHRPQSGVLADTTPNDSAGAQFIVTSAHRLGSASRPLVIATGGPLTDIADAYLLDHTIAGLITVVSALGTADAVTATMAVPNGESDPWADEIVATTFRYVQVSTYYDQSAVVPTSRVPELPNSAFGKWLGTKRSMLNPQLVACDQISVMAVALPAFVRGFVRMAVAGTVPVGMTDVPQLALTQMDGVWIVTNSAPAVGTDAFWRTLLSLRP